MDLTASEHDHDRGLAFDVARLLDRRRALTLLGGAGLASLLACGGSSDATAGSSSTTAAPNTGPATVSTTTAGAASCEAIPEETAGPFPGDGSNGADALSQTGIVRRDITSSFGTGSMRAEGVALTVELTVVDSADGCAPMPGAAVYVWHCDREGRYSLYSDGVTDENFLRGVQVADAAGKVTFRTIFPGCYPGRWPHIHFEIYPNLAKATAGTDKLRTTQLAFAEDLCRSVYGADGYAGSATNLGQISLATDMVFADGYSLQMATTEGSPAKGIAARLTTPV